MKTLIQTSLAIPLLCLATLLSWSPAAGATITVANTNDDGAGSLRAAIESAVSGDTINFNVSLPATITLQSALLVTGKIIAITGPGAANLFISGNINVPVFVFHGGATVSGLTIENGNSVLGGCIFNGFETLTLIDVKVRSCYGQLGGGILNLGTLNVTNSTISSGVVGAGSLPGIGGGILNFGGTVTLNGSTVSNNLAYFFQCTYGNTLRGCGGGGGIYNTAGGIVTLTNSKLLDNFSVDGGGLLNYNGTATLKNSSVVNNTAQSNGAGLENAASGVLTVIDSTISGNLAYGQGYPYTVIDMNVDPGGACDPADPPDPDCPIIYGPPVPASSVGGGGGVRNVGGGAILTNTTIADNSTNNALGEHVGGGGIWVSGVLLATNVTLSGNNASCAANTCPGGAIFSAFAHIEIKNSIVANTPQGGNCSINGGNVISGNHNLSDDATCPFSAAGHLNSTPAGLDSAGLTDNGGQTKTIALLPNSAAVNAIPRTDCTNLEGVRVETDQRGVLRPQGPRCDIGGYEYFASNFPIAAVNTYRLIGAVDSLPLDPGTKQGLAASLQAAVNSINRDDVKPAGNQLRAFINQTNALVESGALTAAQGSMLTAQAEAIIQMIGA
jgi:hypothetical protein